MRKKHIQQYRAKSGLMQFRPSIQLAMTMDEENQGFCLACGEINDGVEPDAAKGECDGCGKYKVYGAAELVLMGLTFDA